MRPFRSVVNRPAVLALALVLAVAVMTGCSFNLFSVFHGGGGKSYKGLVTQGDDAYAAGDYQTALEKYDAAVTENPEGSKARVGYVNAFCRIHFVDFLYIAQQFGTTNFNPTTLLNDPIVNNGVVGTSGVFQQTIDYLDDIANGLCDEEIPFDDFGVNLQLSLSYLFRGLVKIADSNGNGTIADAGDLMTLDAAGMPAFNPSVLNFGAIASNLSLASTPSNGISSGGGGTPLDVFGAIAGSFNSLTNMMFGTNTDYRYFLEAIHDSIEVSLNLIKTFKGPFDYIDLSFAALNRIADRYDYNSIVTNVTQPVKRIYAQVNNYKTMLDPFATSFNALHGTVTGTPAYAGDVSTFVPSTFSSHLASPGGLMAPLSIAYSSLWNTPLTNGAVTNLQSILQGALSSFTNIDLTTLIGQWLGGMAGGF
jgi:hypothetical protein